MKRFTLITLSLACFLGSAIAQDLNTADNLEINGIEYSILTENSVAVREWVNKSELINIPATVTIDDKEYSVTRIMPEAFKDNTVTYALKLPETVTSIGGYNFEGCYMLRSLAIPASVKEIGKNGNKKSEFFSKTPIQAVSFLGSEIPAGDLNYIFESPYIKRIAIPTEATAAYESAYPSLKKNRIKIELNINPNQIEPFSSDFKISPDFVYVPDTYYPNSFNYNIIDLPEHTTLYINPGEPLPLFMNFMLVHKLSYKIGGTEYKPTKSGFVVDRTSVWGYGFQIIEGLTQDCKIEIGLSQDSVESVSADFPATFAVYSTDGMLVKSVASRADLDNLPHSVYVLKTADQTLKVIAGK